MDNIDHLARTVIISLLISLASAIYVVNERRSVLDGLKGFIIMMAVSTTFFLSLFALPRIGAGSTLQTIWVWLVMVAVGLAYSDTSKRK